MASLDPVSASLGPRARLRARIQAWWQARLQPTDTLVLTQRNVYILPTKAGWMLAVTLFVLLIASINYQLNLGYMLTFLIAGAAVVGMHVCHGNLRGLSLHLSPPAAHHAGSAAALDVRLDATKGDRFAISLAVLDTDHWSHTDVTSLGSASVQVTHTLARRGWHALPLLTAETRFPLGTFRVWTVWRPASQVLVYPAAESHPPALPAGTPVGGGLAATQVQVAGEYDGVRGYRRGDPMKLVVWKKAAKSDDLVSRDTVQHQRLEMWLDFAHCGASGTEARLSRLTAWVLAAEKNGLNYGLRVHGLAIEPAQGEAHKRRCLEALATC